jgi:type IV secretory pathway ATPase VirB11/archaellum biosynthesis ATPase
MENGLERRASKRLEMKLPATIVQSTTHNGNEHHLLLTRDISSNGTYFNILKPFTYDGHVQDVILIDISCDCDKVIYIILTASGNVVRCGESGMAWEPGCKDFRRI